MIRKIISCSTALLLLSAFQLTGQDKAPEKGKKPELQEIYKCEITEFDGWNPFKTVVDVFEKNRNVRKLSRIEDMAKVKILVDFDRFAGSVSADKKPSAEDHAAAAAIARPGASPENEKGSIESKSEEEKTDDAAKDTENASASLPKEQNKTTPEDASFFITGNASGILFALKSKTCSQAFIELIMTPEESGRFGKAGLHIVMDQITGKAKNLAWQYNGEYDFPRKARSFTWTLKTGDSIAALYIPWEAFVNTIGELPMNGVTQKAWRFNVFRWVGDTGASYGGGTPHDFVATPFLLLPKFTSKQVSGIQSSLLNNAINAFYDKKNGQGLYFEYILNHLKGAKRYNENFGLRMRLAYTRSYSERYLCEKPEMLEDFTARTLKIAQDCRELKSEEAIAAAFAQHYELFANWQKEMETLRLQALRDKVFSDSFGDE